MLIIQPKISIFSRIVTNLSGERIEVFFAVREISGVREVRVVGTKPLVDESVEEAIALLPGATTHRFGASIMRVFESAVLSPLSSLSFLLSQPARAPNFAF